MHTRCLHLPLTSPPPQTPQPWRHHLFSPLPHSRHPPRRPHARPARFRRTPQTPPVRGPHSAPAPAPPESAPATPPAPSSPDTTTAAALPPRAPWAAPCAVAGTPAPSPPSVLRSQTGAGFGGGPLKKASFRHFWPENRETARLGRL